MLSGMIISQTGHASFIPTGEACKNFFKDPKNDLIIALGFLILPTSIFVAYQKGKNAASKLYVKNTKAHIEQVKDLEKMLTEMIKVQDKNLDNLNKNLNDNLSRLLRNGSQNKEIKCLENNTEDPNKYPANVGYGGDSGPR